MSKKEFLEKLSDALTEKMDISEAMSHVKYYRDYIESEIAKGRSEREVIESLQSPRLIAKNITMNIDSANKYSRNLNENYSEYTDTHSNNSSKKDNNGKGVTFSINGKPINGTVFKIISFLLVAVFVVLVFAIIGVVTWLFFKFVVPVLLIIMVISLIKNIFMRK